MDRKSFVAACLILAVSACAIPQARDLVDARESHNETPVILVDTKTNCRFQLVEPVYLSSSALKWVQPGWDGACVDGWAEGPGVARVGFTVPPQATGHDLRKELGLVDPPWLVTHGNFSHGLAEGAVLIETPLGINMFAWFRHGIKAKSPTALVQYVDGFGSWDKYPDQTNSDHDGSNFPPLTGFAKTLLGQAPHRDFTHEAALLDFSKYPTPATMRTAIAAAHPLLSNASDFLEVLRIAAFHRVTTVLGADAPDISCRHALSGLLGMVLAETYTICTATRQINVGHDNTDRWVAQFVFAQNGAFIGIAVDRFFDGTNFPVRKIALSAKDFFDPNSFLRAALQVLDGNVTRQTVTILMKNAGLVPVAGVPGRMAPQGNDPEIPFDFVRPAPVESEARTFGISNQNIAESESGCNLKFGLVWYFSRADGRFVRTEPVQGGPCL